MKRPLIFLSLGAVVGCTCFSIFFINVLAKEPPKQETVSYYTYIQIQPGDTLWTIAEIYTEGTDISVEDYVRQLKQMNHIGEDTIHVGNYLTVMYKNPRGRKAEQKQRHLQEHPEPIDTVD
ncbi:MAG: LysM peptidoglycan-binding domain-containing protein [Hungatella sp.]|nr:LysM peptidoglycan-binding domain-containing protein [Hungatella sp.]